MADNYFLLHNELNLINFIFKVTVCVSPLINWSLSPRNSAFLGCAWRNGLQIWRVAANILNKQSRTADKGWYSSLGVGRSANNCSLPKSNHVTNCCKKPRNQTDPSVRPKQWKRDMRFGTWNVRSLHKSRSLMTVVGELARYKLDLVWEQEVRYKKGVNARAEDSTFFYEKGNENHQLGTEFFVHQRILPAVKIVEFGSDRMLYTCIILRGRWCNIVLNAHVSTEEKNDDTKNNLGGIREGFRSFS